MIAAHACILGRINSASSSYCKFIQAIQKFQSFFTMKRKIHRQCDSGSGKRQHTTGFNITKSFEYNQERASTRNSNLFQLLGNHAFGIVIRYDTLILQESAPTIQTVPVEYSVEWIKKRVACHHGLRDILTLSVVIQAVECSQGKRIDRRHW